MKPKSKSILDGASRQFTYAPLYLPDLEQIVACAAARKLSVKITDEHHEYDNLADLRENAPPRVLNLTLNFREVESALYDAQLKITPDGVKITANKTDSLLAHWYEIVEIVEHRAPWYSRFLQPFLWGFLALTLSSVLTKIELQDSAWQIQTAVFCAATFFSLVSLYHLKVLSGVHLKKEHEVSSLWEKYAEKILLLLIGGFIGLLVKWVGDNLLSK